MYESSQRILVIVVILVDQRPAAPPSDRTTWRIESAAGVLNSLSLIPAKENSSERTHS